MEHFGTIMFTPSVQVEQTARGSRDTYARMTERPAPDALGEDERAFIESRNSFYMATVSETGWPYVQHRGGPRGFLKMLDGETLGFADYRGNRQFVSTGNLARDDRVSLFLMDYPRKARLKLLGHASVTEAEADAELAARLAVDEQGRAERLMTIRIVAFDWNCPQFITPRFDAGEIAALVAPEMTQLQARISELETENAALRSQLKDIS